jgi:hypothetical protein
MNIKDSITKGYKLSTIEKELIDRNNLSFSQKFKRTLGRIKVAFSKDKTQFNNLENAIKAAEAAFVTADRNIAQSEYIRTTLNKVGVQMNMTEVAEFLEVHLHRNTTKVDLLKALNNRNTFLINLGAKRGF